MKKLALILAAIFLFSSGAFALSDPEYEKLKAGSADFAAADKQLGKTYKAVKAALDENAQKELLQEKRAWIKNGWDNSAREHMENDGMSRPQAYTAAIKDRIEELEALKGNSGETLVAQADNGSATAIPVTAQNAGDTAKIVTVEAEGSGETKLAAMKAAWTDAVRKAVGMYMTSKTETLNDDLTEQIAAYSRGQVNSFETLSEEKDANGLWTVKIKANVDQDIMQETVAASTSQKVKVDGADLAAQIQSIKDKKKDAGEVLATSGLLDFSKCLDYEPAIVKFNNDGDTVLAMRHILKMDLGKFKKQSEELEKLIAAMATGKRTVALKAANSKNVLKAIQAKKYDLKINWMSYNLKEDGAQLIVFYPRYTSALNISDDSWAHGEEINHDEYSDILQFAEQPRKNEFCFFKNASKADCYQLSSSNMDIINKLAPIYKMTFTTENGVGYDSIISTSPLLALSFNYFYTYDTPIHALIQPLISCYNTQTGGISSFFYHGFSFDNTLAPVLIYYQKLDFNVDDLASLKELTGKYTLKPLNPKSSE